MYEITDRMIDDFYGEYEKPRKVKRAFNRSFLDDILDEEDSPFCDEEGEYE